MKNYLIFAYVTIVLFVLHLSTQQNDAIGYPSTSISKTTNPLWAFGGVVTSSSGVTLATAHTDQIMVLTDIIFSTMLHVVVMKRSVLKSMAPLFPEVVSLIIAPQDRHPVQISSKWYTRSAEVC